MTKASMSVDCLRRLAWCVNPYSCDEEGDDLCEQLREAQRDLEGMLRLCRNPASVFHKDRDRMQAAWEPVLDDVECTLALMDGEIKSGRVDAPDVESEAVPGARSRRLALGWAGCTAAGSVSNIV